MSKIISISDGKDLISKAFPEQDVNFWHLCDKVLRLPSISEIVEITSGLEVMKFIPEIADCDNLALLLAARFVRRGLAIAIIDVEQLDYGINHPDYRHQLCATIVNADPLYVVCIEPRTGSIFKPNELLRLKFVDLRT